MSQKKTRNQRLKAKAKKASQIARVELEKTTLKNVEAYKGFRLTELQIKKIQKVLEEKDKTKRQTRLSELQDQYKKGFERRQFNVSGTTSTAYTKKFADIAEQGFESQKELNQYIDYPDIPEIVDMLNEIFNNTTSDYMAYDEIQEESQRTIDDCRDACYDALSRLDLIDEDENVDEIFRVRNALETLLYKLDSWEMLFAIKGQDAL